MTLQEAAADYARARKRIKDAGILREKAKQALNDSENEYVDARRDLDAALSTLEAIAEDPIKNQE